jgi:hypothetical protein
MEHPLWLRTGLPTPGSLAGEWGDSADDVACLTANYLFFSLQRSGRLAGALATLFVRFWERYLERSADYEMLEVVAPFYAFRGLVMASPVWSRLYRMRFVEDFSRSLWPCSKETGLIPRR